jgi:hypothetical protein
VIATDLNGDGWLDLLTREIGGRATAWMAQCDASSWLNVVLEQSGGNPSAVGATVVVSHGDQTQSRWLTLGASGLQSTAPVEAHYGLGTASTVDIEVQWPDGLRSTFVGVAVNQDVRIVRAD